MSRCLLHLLTVLALIGWSVYAFGQLQNDVDAPVGIVIPHHDMVASARRAYLAKVSREVQPETIVLLSPDHFGTNKYPLVASTRLWQTSLGEVKPNNELIESLGLPVDAADFLGEHGVTGLLRDLKQYFPKASIVPVMLSQQASYSVIEQFVANLYIQCSRCLLVASVDFSHSSEVHVADVHDRLTLRELYRGSAEDLYAKAEVDSPQSLAALALWANYHSAPRFELFSHTNSGQLSKQAVGEMTTHIIGGYMPGQVITNFKDSAFMMFGGDVMFARGVDETHRAKPAEVLTTGLGNRFFWGVDQAVINLEGVFSASPEYEEGWDDLPPRLRFHSNYVEALTAARIDTVSLANNHSADGGEAELLFTKNLLERRGVKVLAPSVETDPTAHLMTIGDTKVALLGVATHSAMTDLTPVITRYAKDGYRVVIVAHWGDEYMSEPSADQQAMAKRWVDAGATLIVGSHPHVIQKVAVYNGVPIVYSLGNLLFDQGDSPSTRTGLVIAAEIDTEGVRLSAIPVESYLKPRPVSYDLLALLTDWEEYQEDDQNQVFYFPY